MDNQNISDRFADLSTPLLSDACLRLEIPIRIAEPGIQPLNVGDHIAGHVLPVKHYGSVDIFLAAMNTAQQGDVLVIDNGGRSNEGCIGDLTLLEAQACGLKGMVIWGCHRDTAELIRIGFPVFSYGAYPAGPQRLVQRDPKGLAVIHFHHFNVTTEDVVFADVDGVVFIPDSSVDAVLSTAYDIRQQERQQAQAIQAGTTLYEQFRFDDYLARCTIEPTYTFRQHLRKIGGAIEE